MAETDLFKWRHYESEIILLCARWYLRCALSYRDGEEMMNERGLSEEGVLSVAAQLRQCKYLNYRKNDLEHAQLFLMTSSRLTALYFINMGRTKFSGRYCALVGNRVAAFCRNHCNAIRVRRLGLWFSCRTWKNCFCDLPPDLACS